MLWLAAFAVLRGMAVPMSLVSLRETTRGWVRESSLTPARRDAMLAALAAERRGCIGLMKERRVVAVAIVMEEPLTILDLECCDQESASQLLMGLVRAANITLHPALPARWHVAAEYFSPSRVPGDGTGPAPG